MNQLYKQYNQALKDAPSPALWVDLNAFESNIKWAIQNAGTKKIRIATKSIRSVAMIKKVLESSNIFQGLMTFTLQEALWLKSQGLKDLLMGYPTHDKIGLQELAKDPTEITLMVDLPEHIDYLSGYNTVFNVCIDIDLSMDLPGVRFGVYRSSITNEQKLKTILDKIVDSPHVRLVGLMGYEAQIAGVMDKSSLLMRLLKKISISKLRSRREKMVQMILKRGHKLNFINGGGTGSLKETKDEEVVSEVTVGSAFFAPVLFDNYQNFTLRPAMGFTLPIVRIPKPGMLTCLGGGYIASGAMEAIKTPTPYLPTGLKLEKNEGTGEVQTPLYYSGDLQLKIGDLIFMRHAKAGEPCERFNEIHLLRGNIVESKCLTYRGEGKAFL